MKRPGYDPAEDTTREDLSGWYPTLTPAEQRAADDEQAVYDAMRAHRAAEASQCAEDPDAARLLAEYAAQQRDASANESAHAPTAEEMAGDEALSSFIDEGLAAFREWADGVGEIAGEWRQPGRVAA